MMKMKIKLYKNKEFYRFLLYMLISVLIVYFFWNSYYICQEITKKEIDLTQISEQSIDIKLGIDNIEYKPVIYDLKHTHGGLIWKLFMNIMQIIFLVMLLILMHIKEVSDNWTLKN